VPATGGESGERVAGIVLVLATQRPESKAISFGLRAVLGSRFSLRVMDWRDSNIVLGEQMNTRGYDSSRLLASHKGDGARMPGCFADEPDDRKVSCSRFLRRPGYLGHVRWHRRCW